MGPYLGCTPKEDFMTDEQTLRILILGATGGVGRHVAERALLAGHQVTVLVRDASRLTLAHPALTVRQGDALDAEAVRAVVRGQDAVISVLGAPALNTDRIRERGARVLADAMEAEGVRRLVMLSSHGIFETADELPWHMRWLVVPLYLKRAFADHEGQETVIKGTDLDWTLVRPPHLTDGPATGRFEHGLGADVARSMKIPRADVATFLLQQVSSDAYVRQTPVVAS